LGTVPATEAGHLSGGLGWRRWQTVNVDDAASESTVTA